MLQHRWTLRTVCSVKWGSHRRPNTVLFIHMTYLKLWKIIKKKVERLPRTWGRQRRELVINRYRVRVLQDGKVLEVSCSTMWIYDNCIFKWNMYLKILRMVSIKLCFLLQWKKIWQSMTCKYAINCKYHGYFLNGMFYILKNWGIPEYHLCASNSPGHRFSKHVDMPFQAHCSNEQGWNQCLAPRCLSMILKYHHRRFRLEAHSFNRETTVCW